MEQQPSCVELVRTSEQQLVAAWPCHGASKGLLCCCVPFFKQGVCGLQTLCESSWLPQPTPTATGCRTESLPLLVALQLQ